MISSAPRCGPATEHADLQRDLEDEALVRRVLRPQSPFCRHDLDLRDVEPTPCRGIRRSSPAARRCPGHPLIRGTRLDLSQAACLVAVLPHLFLHDKHLGTTMLTFRKSKASRQHLGACADPGCTRCRIDARQRAAVCGPSAAAAAPAGDAPNARAPGARSSPASARRRGCHVQGSRVQLRDAPSNPGPFRFTSSSRRSACPGRARDGGPRVRARRAEGLHLNGRRVDGERRRRELHETARGWPAAP